MLLDTEKETLSINQIIETKTQEFWIEEDVIVPDIKPDILNIVDVSGNVMLYKKEVLDGKIKLDGGANVYVVYLADNEANETRSINLSMDFSQIINSTKAQAGMIIDENIEIKDTDFKVLNGRKISVSVCVQVEYKMCMEGTVEVLKNIEKNENIRTLKKTIEIDSKVGEGTSKVFAKDTIAIESRNSNSRNTKS